MAYINPRHLGRFTLISHLRNAFAEIAVSKKPPGAVEMVLVGTSPGKMFFQLDEFGSERDEGDLFHFPFLFHKNGSPWFEANAYLLDLLRQSPLKNRPTDEVRRRASKLLDYLIYCEKSGVDWLDFYGRRPVLRPTYKYFYSLVESGGRSAAVINQYTGVVFDFYKYVSVNWHKIDMDRVDSIKKIKFIVGDTFNKKLVTANKRTQTKPIPFA